MVSCLNCVFRANLEREESGKRVTYCKAKRAQTDAYKARDCDQHIGYCIKPQNETGIWVVSEVVV
jgi:hypothetical protein